VKQPRRAAELPRGGAGLPLVTFAEVPLDNADLGHYRIGAACDPHIRIASDRPGRSLPLQTNGECRASPGSYVSALRKPTDGAQSRRETTASERSQRAVSAPASPPSLSRACDSRRSFCAPHDPAARADRPDARPAQNEGYAEPPFAWRARSRTACNSGSGVAPERRFGYVHEGWPSPAGKTGGGRYLPGDGWR